LPAQFSPPVGVICVVTHAPPSLRQESATPVIVVPCTVWTAVVTGYETASHVCSGTVDVLVYSMS
jgi:hypothetical protein